MPTTDPKPTPTTIAELLTLPGWTSDQEPDYADNHQGAVWNGHGVSVSIAWHYDYELWTVTAGDAIPAEYCDASDAIRFALDIAACITAAATNTLAAAAPPPPPTTIAELAARPGWRLDDGDAIHDQTDTLASPISVHLAGDQFWPGDERACAEAAYAVASAAEASHARAAMAAAASAEEERRIRVARQQKYQRRIDRFNAAKGALQSLMPERREMRPGHAREVLAELHRAAYPDGGDIPHWLEKLVAAHLGEG